MVFVKRKHQHFWVYQGYGSAGWAVYKCSCGETEIG